MQINTPVEALEAIVAKCYAETLADPDADRALSIVQAMAEEGLRAPVATRGAREALVWILGRCNAVTETAAPPNLLQDVRIAAEEGLRASPTPTPGEVGRLLLDIRARCFEVDALAPCRPLAEAVFKMADEALQHIAPEELTPVQRAADKLLEYACDYETLLKRQLETGDTADWSEIGRQDLRDMSALLETLCPQKAPTLEEALEVLRAVAGVTVPSHLAGALVKVDALLARVPK